jgi:hypothetical protein
MVHLEETKYRILLAVSGPDKIQYSTFSQGLEPPKNTLTSPVSYILDYTH